MNRRTGRRTDRNGVDAAAGSRRAELGSKATRSRAVGAGERASDAELDATLANIGWRYGGTSGLGEERGKNSSEAGSASRSAPRDVTTILLVEDHADTASVMSMLLEEEGYRVRVASSVRAALLMAEEADLVLSDLTLPDGSGIDLMRRLRGQRKGIALSGFGLEDDVRASLDAGFDLHLRKPVEPDVLVDAVRRTLAEDGSDSSHQRSRLGRAMALLRLES